MHDFRVFAEDDAVSPTISFVFGGRNILPRAELETIGFRVFAVGKPAGG